MHSPIAVIGGAGRTGAIITRRLIEEGHHVRVISRDPARAALPPAAHRHRADVRYTHLLGPALRDCSGIVFTVEPGIADSGPHSPESTVYDGVRNVLAAAADGGQRPHIVLVSQIYVTRREHPMNAYGRLLDWRLRGEDEVRASGLPYTVVRPGWLTDGDAAGTRVRLEQHDRGDGWVSRKSLAEACVQSLRLPGANGTTFELYNEPGKEPADWGPLFGRLVPDRVPAYPGPPR